MEAKDVRIGNWLILGKEFMEVHNITYDRTLEFCINYPHTPVSDYNPIPLSPEILERCGFNGKYKSCGYNYQKDGVHISSQDTDDLGNSLENYVFHVYVDYKYEPIYFLHDLQNRFYSLTKTELNYQP